MKQLALAPAAERNTRHSVATLLWNDNACHQSVTNISKASPKIHDYRLSIDTPRAYDVPIMVETVEISEVEDKDHADSPPEHPAQHKKLGISRTTVALGNSAKDAGLTLLATTLVLAPTIHYGRNRVLPIARTAEAFDKFFSLIRNFMKKGTSDWAPSIGAAGTIGLGFSYLAHLPALIYGPQQVKDAETRYNNEIRDNERLTRDNARLRGIYNEEVTLNNELKQQNNALKKEGNAQFQSIITRHTANPNHDAASASPATFAERVQTAPSHSPDVTP